MKRSAFILEAVQSCDDSPILGKILAFAGENHSQVMLFISENRDFIVVGDPADANSWHWRETEMTMGDFESSPIVREFNQDGTEKAS